MIKVLIVDDHPMILEGLKSLLIDDQDMEVTALCTSAKESLAAIKNNLPHVALLDINLPDISGIDLCIKIKSEFPTVKTIALTTFSDRTYVNKMLEAGASGYLIKSSAKEEIINAIKQVHKGGLVLNVPFDFSNTALFKKDQMPILTPREKEVLNYIAEGYTNPQIAEALFVSVLTINSHRKNLLNKFEVTNTAALIKKAAQMDLI